MAYVRSFGQTRQACRSSAHCRKRGTTALLAYNEPANVEVSLPHSLTGIIDENGVRLAAYRYGADGRAVSTEHGQGIEKHTIAYVSEGVSKVTDPQGTTRTFSSQVLHDVPRNVSLDLPCPDCGSVLATSYDANGFLQRATDFNGVVTEYAHDARGLESKRTRAVGTADARTVTTEWHASFHLPTRIAEPLRTTSYSYDERGTLTSLVQQPTDDPDGSRGFSATSTGLARTRIFINIYSGTHPGSLIRQAIDGPRSDVA